MNVLSKNSGSNMDTTPSFHDLKRQASFFFREKIKTARLVLTDATPAQLMTEEATSGNTWTPDTPTLRSISRAAFEIDDYTRIVEILHKRFLKFERKNWRVSYNSLIVLERLLTHGPESVAGEFRSDKDAIGEMKSFHHIDEKGFDWGLAVRKKSERILKLVEKGPLLKEERDRARNVTRGIQGFGSFSQQSSPAKGMLTESSSVTTFGRSNSQFNSQENQDNQFSISNKGLTKEVKKSQQSHEVIMFQSGNKVVNERSWDSLCNCQVHEKAETLTSYKENLAPKKEELHRWNFTGESNPLLDGKKNEPRIEMSMEEDHPFTGTENQTTASLLMQIPQK
ncbi:epsin-3-like [Juglans microcarpa x Juglans regia]|uniref:epsin-3-like n=1 Tax=Juglans microcarpa x Juglans regia TaxID=2249226 RepID=UPI001B7E28DC|nr:epsin-3-like [Juglans microcarpa x Juglans regia]